MELFASRTKKIWLTILIIGLAFLLLFSLCSCKPLDAEYVTSKLLPNLWVFLAHLMSAGVLITVMTWLVWKPAKGMIQKRHDLIAKEINDAIKAKEQANIEYSKANQIKVDALGQAMKITSSAKEEAFNIVKQAKADAIVESNKIKTNAQKDIEKQKIELKNKVHNQVVDIAFDVASNILQKEVTPKDNDKYIDELLESISKDIDRDK